MWVITRNYTFPQLMQLTSRFHFLVTLGLPGSDTKPFSKYIQFQCNCGLFWRRCARPLALLLWTYLKKTSGGFEAKVVRRKIPSRVGLCKKGMEVAKEYCRLARPACPPKLRTTPKVLQPSKTPNLTSLTPQFNVCCRSGPSGGSPTVVVDSELDAVQVVIVWLGVGMHHEKVQRGAGSTGGLPSGGRPVFFGPFEKGGITMVVFKAGLL
jgi:hypothetical protein